MKSARFYLALALLLGGAFVCKSASIASKPLYRDPIFDGAADPVVIWNPQVKRWWMFYTNRRANVPGLSGITWVDGTPIGIAESANGGAHWNYVGTAQFELPPDYGGTNVTCWAPDVTRTRRHLADVPHSGARRFRGLESSALSRPAYQP